MAAQKKNKNQKKNGAVKEQLIEIACPSEQTRQATQRT